MFGKTTKVEDPYHLYLLVFKNAVVNSDKRNYDVDDEQGELAIILAVSHAGVIDVRSGKYPWTRRKFRAYFEEMLIGKNVAGGTTQ